MSRGTRVGYDVMGNMPEDEEDSPEIYPTQIKFPESFSPGTGRIGSLNDQLRRVYEHIGHAKNDISRGHQGNKKANTLMPEYMSLISMFNKLIKDGEKDVAGFEATAKTLISEVRAVGGEPFSVDFAKIEEVAPAYLVPNGSLSYLCRPTHYFAPEDISVPEELPNAHYNQYLETKYSLLAKSINRICYFRHQRLCLGKNSSDYVAFSRLSVEIPESRKLFDSVIKFINDKKPKYGDQIFLMPIALRDKIMEDNSLINHSELPDISCLYPEGLPESSPIHNGKAVYVLFESAMGYSLFRANNTSSPPSLLNFETFKSSVKLIEHYPFLSQAIALEEYQHIKSDTCSVMLKLFLEMFLRPLEAWSYSRYRLGVRNRRNFARSIKDTTGITCRRRRHYVKELRLGIAQYLHLFLDIEQTSLVEAQQALNNKLEDDNPQEE